MKNTHSVKFNSAFDASHFMTLVEFMGAADVTVGFKDNWYTVEYTADAVFAEKLDSYLENV